MGFAFAFALIAGLAQPGPSIIPQPASMRLGTGTFALSSDAKINVTQETRWAGEVLRRYLRPATGYDLPIASTGSITLRLDPRLDSTGAEGYRLVVTPSGISIRAAAKSGLFYGIQTLRQLFDPDIFRRSKTEKEWRIQSVVIEDKPRFGWRGAHMDVARHFMPKEFIFKFLDLMAMHKLNTFHWHLVDDNGWRVEIKRFPKLTEVGSKTDFSAMNPTSATRSINQKPGGFYTQDDIREVVQYAADRFITVVPEFEMPGHSKAAVDSYPELGNRGQIEAAGGDAKFLGAYDNVYNVDDSTIQFLKNVLDEMLDLFPSKFIHIGGDEVWKEPWKRNPRAQERMKALDLKTEEDLQSWFIKQFDDYLTKKGRRLIGWDEILEGGLAPGAAVMSWRGTAGGIAAAKAGHDVVMAPNEQTYFDHYQSRFTEGEPKAIGGFTDIREVYEYEPIPPELSPSEATHVLGAQSQLWSEFIPHPRHMEYMAYPRTTALAEVVWSPAALRNYDDFMARLKEHLKRLDVIDVNYRRLDGPMPKPAATWSSGETSEQFAMKEWDVTPAISGPGDYEAVFIYTSGAHRLDVEWVDLIEQANDLKPGVTVIAKDEHPGQTGGETRDNRYRLSVKAIRPAIRYVLRASVRSDGGTDSNGEIYLIKRG